MIVYLFFLFFCLLYPFHHGLKWEINIRQQREFISIPFLEMDNTQAEFRLDTANTEVVFYFIDRRVAGHKDIPLLG